MKLNSFYIIFFSLIFCDECLNNWYNINKSLFDSEIMHFKADIILENRIDTNKLNLFFDITNSKLKLEIEDKIFLFDTEKSSKFFKKTNQVYIDYPDTLLLEKLQLIFNNKLNSTKNQLLKVKNNTYKISYDNIIIKFDDECEKIISVYSDGNRMKFQLLNIIKNISLGNGDDIFSIQGNFFKYDMRK